MSLVLGASIGDRVSIGPNWIELVQILGPRTVQISTSDGRRVLLDDGVPRTVFPGVRLGLGPRPMHYGIRVVIDAPRRLKISRST
jgi:hypothetical protein